VHIYKLQCRSATAQTMTLNRMHNQLTITLQYLINSSLMSYLFPKCHENYTRNFSDVFLTTVKQTRMTALPPPRRGEDKHSVK